MKFFDTHCHLNIPPLKEIYSEVIESAQKNNIDYLVIPGTNYDDCLIALEIANKFDDVYCAIGLHPNELTKKDLRELIFDLNRLKKNLDNHKIVAIGEIGLDKKAKNFKLQEELLILQIKLAKEYQKSLIIHNREMSEMLISILKKEWNNYFEHRVVFHCSEPNEKILRFAKEKNIYLGFDGDLTYDKTKQEFIRKVPLELMVIETDSPFLLPEPLRTFIKHQTNKEEIRFYPNKPENLILIFQFLTKLINVNEEVIANQLLENSLNLFNLK